MNREVLKYTIISLLAITVGLAGYYAYTIYKEKRK